MLGIARKLRKAGVVGINARNRDYVALYNRRALYRLVDDKLQTKHLAHEAGITVPELYGVVSTVHDARYFQRILEDRQDFVVKPAHGSGGNGIMVIARRRSDRYFKPDGVALDAQTIEHHIANILGGMYSLGGQVDQAIIEYRVQFDPVFESLSYQGVPDIRIVVYRGVPAMAMIRLPTRESDGKANLHQGAVGAGLDLATGVTTLAVSKNRRIEEHPDFGTPLAGHQVPGWENLLATAARCYEIAPLGYLGVDMVLDSQLGPMLLELNARPGLSIQIANGRGLRHSLDAIDAAEPLPQTAAERVALGKSVFKDAA